MYLLQPLRIPTGWKVEYNKFLEVEIENLKETGDIWNFSYTEDILLFSHIEKRKKDHKRIEYSFFIDLGWYPDGDPKGNFCLLVVKNGDWLHPLQKFESRNKNMIVNTLEKWLEFYIFHTNLLYL